MSNTLILRFSAIGDVAMTVPVIDSLARQYPENEYTVVSQSFLSPLFEYCPDNVRFVGVDFKSQYKGIFGIYRLFKDLSKHKFDSVADLHDVLRTKILRVFFRCNGLKIRHIDKGRKDKRRLTRKENKIFRQLKPTIERYADVFAALGQTIEHLEFRSVFEQRQGASLHYCDFKKIAHLTGEKSGQWLGIAPFAKHVGKMLPTERMEQVVAYFADKADITIFLFGGGAAEKAILQEWESKYPKTISVAGKLDLSAELVLISRLNVMLSMDSANMHLASLTATPVVSIWGATHPYAGFYGYNQSPDNALQLELPCRPCSIYGNKACYRGNRECLEGITVEMLVLKMNNLYFLL